MAKFATLRQTPAKIVPPSSSWERSSRAFHRMIDLITLSATTNIHLVKKKNKKRTTMNDLKKANKKQGRKTETLILSKNHTM